MSDIVTGGCQCGALRYELRGSLPAAYACHCGECKKQTASAFSMSIPTSHDALKIEGDVAMFESRAHSGKHKFNYFCGQCGTRLWHSPTNPPREITLKVGTLDDSADINPVAHLWTSKLQAGINLDPDSEQHLTQPDDVAGWRNNLGNA